MDVLLGLLEREYLMKIHRLQTCDDAVEQIQQ